VKKHHFHFISTALVIVGFVCLQLLHFSLAQTQESSAQTYPKEWDVPVRSGTALAEIKAAYTGRRAAATHVDDLQDRSPLPSWFRDYLRANLNGLPEGGRYQYPRVSVEILEWMLSHQDLKPAPPGGARRPVRRTATQNRPAGSVSSDRTKLRSDVNVSDADERNSESYIAIDERDPRTVIVASNNLSGSGRQKQFYSADSGATWGKAELPLPMGIAMHSDPTLAFSTDGTAWAATLGIDNTGTSVTVQVYKSLDHGASWQFDATISEGSNNDKELLWIDEGPNSPFKDNIYVAWDVPGGGMRFARSKDKGRTWSKPLQLSADRAIGAHLVTGPSGELYVAWPDTDSKKIVIRRSDDGGATFQAAHTITTTHGSYEITIPAMCRRKALIYVTLGVDRSNGPGKGNVYATWTDLVGNDSVDCSDTSSRAAVHFSSSRDGGNSWSTPRIIPADLPSTDRFNQWMAVDPQDGSISVLFYDTRGDSARKKTEVYGLMSIDGGQNWAEETKLSTGQSDETVSPADLGNQYGDYNSLAAYGRNIHGSWTDRRPSIHGGKEQIYTAPLQTGSSAAASPPPSK